MSQNDDLPEGAPVPSMGSLFDDPESTPPVVPARAGTEGGRLYRSAHAAGPAAALAIQALPRPRPVDESLPLSPEALAAEQASAPPVPPAEPVTPVESAEQAAEPAGHTETPEAPDPASAMAAAAVVAETPTATPTETPTETPVETPAEGAPERARTPEAPAAPAVPEQPLAAEGPTPWPAEAAILPAAAVAAAVPAPAVPTPAVPEPAVPLAVQPAAPAPAVLALPVAEPVAQSSLPWLTWTQATLLMIGVTIVAAIVDVLLRHGIGAITGIGLVIATVICALRLRREDIWAAVVVPPLAFLTALVTVGQFAIGSTGGFISRQALNIVTGLSLNAPWILGATGLGLIIVLVRRHRGGPVDATDEPVDAADASGSADVTPAAG